MHRYERGPVAVKVYSENQDTVDALAERLERSTSFTADQARLVAYDLLCRKALKIKSSALAQIFRSVDKDCDTKARRDELIAAGIVTKIEGSGVQGRPAFYTIEIEIVGQVSSDDETKVTEQLDGGEAAPTVRSHVDTDETLDENVVRAFTARAGHSFGGGGKRDAQRRAAQDRFRRAVAEKTAGAEEAQKPESQAAAVPAEKTEERPAVSKRRPGAHFRMAEKPLDERFGQGERSEQKPAEPAAPQGDKAVKKPVNCRPGRGFAQDRVQEKPQGERPRDEVEISEMAKEGEKSPEPRKQMTSATVTQKKEAPKSQRRDEPKPSKQQEASSDTKREKTAGEKPEGGRNRRRSRKTPEGRLDAAPKDEKNQASIKKGRTDEIKGAPRPKQQGAKGADTRPEKAAGHGDESRATATPAAIARVLGRRILKAIPTSHALAKIKEQQTQIVKVDKKDKKPAAPQRPAHNDMSNRKIAEDVATVQAWLEKTRELDVPFASRRQRAYQIFNDEKAFDGKRGERLVKRLGEKNISMQTLRVTPNKPVHFTGFFTLGADKPFIMVENLDTYDEIVKLLRGRKNAKLFGIKVGGVIFGGGCKASVSHALDDYLDEIGYRFGYVYYVGDIDREGARIVEQTRNANVVEIRLHAGMYRAMLAEHKRRVKAGGVCEPAAANQGVPQNLAATIKDLPMVTRVQFRNVLREGGRIPQEILMSADYRDGDSGSFDRMLNS